MHSTTPTGSILRRARKAKGMQLKQAAKALNITSTYLSDLELGRRYWSNSMVDNYITVLEAPE